MLTDKSIAQALIDAKARGVRLEIIANGASSREKFSKINMLKDAGLMVYLYEPKNESGMFSEIMHHKFLVFEKNVHDKALLWTGSFNLTKSANERNHENVVIIQEPALVEQYDKKFDQIKEAIIKNNKESNMQTKKYTYQKNKRKKNRLKAADVC